MIEERNADSLWNQWLFQQIGLKTFDWIRDIVISNRFSFEVYQLISNKLNLTNKKLSQQFDEAFDWKFENDLSIRNRIKQLLKVL